MTQEISWSISWFSSSFINSMSCWVLGSELSLSLTLWKTTVLSLRSVFKVSVTFWGTGLSHNIRSLLILFCTHWSIFIGVTITVAPHTLWDSGWLSITCVVRLLYFLLETDLTLRLGFLDASCSLSFGKPLAEKVPYLSRPSYFGPCKSVESVLIWGNFTSICVSTERVLVCLDYVC